MIQCKDCEFCETSSDGRKVFKCDPFSNIKEPACLEKWQLIKLDMLLASYHAMQRGYEKMAPLQDKMFKYIQREIDDIDETEKWKVKEDEHDEDENQNNFQ